MLNLTNRKALMNSEILKFFLSEDRDKFQKKIKKKGFLKKLVNKLKDKGENKENTKSRNQVDNMDVEEKQKLNLYLKSMKEHLSKNLKLYVKIEKTMEKLFSQYKQLSKTIFKLADFVGELSSNSEKIEKLSAENLKFVPLKSKTFNTFKVALYSWSHEISQTQSNFKKNFEPLIRGMKNEVLQIKNVSSPINTTHPIKKY